jgi:hypothetical protein
MMYLGLNMAAMNYEQAWKDILAKMPLEQRLAGLDPAQVLSTFDPAQRLAGLDDAHAVLALPIGALRGLSAEYVESLPDDVKTEVKRRLAQP